MWIAVRTGARKIAPFGFVAAPAQVIAAAVPPSAIAVDATDSFEIVVAVEIDVRLCVRPPRHSDAPMGWVGSGIQLVGGFSSVKPPSHEIQ